MNSNSLLLTNVIIRNLLGLLALIALHFLTDYGNLVHRTGFSKVSPYIFLILMYGWIVFHNRVLFDNLFLKDKKAAYFAWTGLAMALCSANMLYIITTSFHVQSALPQIISFWVYTVAGLGVYLAWKNLVQRKEYSETPNSRAANDTEVPTTFNYMLEGKTYDIPLNSVYYFESLENYVRIINRDKPIVVRLTLKEVESQLPRPQFLRISRSHIVNMDQIDDNDGNTIRIKGQALKVGKVFKRYVETQSGNLNNG